MKKLLCNPIVALIFLVLYMALIGPALVSAKSYIAAGTGIIGLLLSITWVVKALTANPKSEQ